jgi:hypothetical protein
VGRRPPRPPTCIPRLMSVEKVMRDPEWVDIPEQSEARGLARGGPCLVCGEWIDRSAADAYRILVSNPPREAEYACHEACFARAAHPSVQVPS